jgi:hypothetical protein
MIQEKRETEEMIDYTPMSNNMVTEPTPRRSFGRGCYIALVLNLTALEQPRTHEPYHAGRSWTVNLFQKQPPRRLREPRLRRLVVRSPRYNLYPRRAGRYKSVYWSIPYCGNISRNAVSEGLSLTGTSVYRGILRRIISKCISPAKR